MSLISSVIQVSFFYKLGEMNPPPVGPFMYIALDTFTVVTALQIIMSIKSTELFRREKLVLKMKYSPSSFFLSHWMSSLMNLKMYGVVSSTISFWIIALPNPTVGTWF